MIEIGAQKALLPDLIIDHLTIFSIFLHLNETVSFHKNNPPPPFAPIQLCDTINKDKKLANTENQVSYRVPRSVLQG